MKGRYTSDLSSLTRQSVQLSPLIIMEDVMFGRPSVRPEISVREDLVALLYSHVEECGDSQEIRQMADELRRELVQAMRSSARSVRAEDVVVAHSRPTR